MAAGDSVTPQPSPATANYVITDEDQLGEGGARAKYRDNIAALKVLMTLREEGRKATAEEQAVLVRYVGWGGLPQAFDSRNESWQDAYKELEDLLPQEEYEAARRSTQNAHYTSQTVINGIYQGLERLGFKGGEILEPSVGTGNFIGLLPEAMREGTHFTGIELDGVTAEIAGHLYPEATVRANRFEAVQLEPGIYDAVVGNPPFSENKAQIDGRHPELKNFSLHNYFLAKSLDKLRPGGVMGVVVSRYFMDAANPSAREHIAQQAHFLGAIRLPNTAFKKNALTEVTTDIVFFQKAAEGEETDRRWVGTGTVKDQETYEDITINQYFVDHPEQMIGRMAITNKMHRGTADLIAAPGDLATNIAQRLQVLPENVYRAASAEEREDIAKRKEYGKPILDLAHIKMDAFFVTPDGQLAQRIEDRAEHHDYEYVTTRINSKKQVVDLGKREVERICGMVGVRNALRDLIDAEQRNDVSDADLDAKRATLNRLYDEFVREFNHLNNATNRRLFADDPEAGLLQGLEIDYDKGVSATVAKNHGVEPRAASAQKAAIFSRRVLKVRREVEHVETAKDALVVSMNEHGGVYLDYMSKLCGKSEDDIIRELKGRIYRNPASGQWEVADRYLTGNVKRKLAVAKTVAAYDPAYAENVAALEAVQPADIEPVDIAVQLGSTWVPPETVKQFVHHLLGENVPANILYVPEIGKWSAQIDWRAVDRTLSTVTWGIPQYHASELIESILTNKAIQVKKKVEGPDGEEVSVVDPEQTAAANQKADEIRQAFLDWIWQDKDRRESLARLYNDMFNVNVAPTYDGSHLELPGAALGIELRPHQKNAVWRGIQEGTALFDHVVGAGKTMVCCATIMESKRMNLMSKPMVVVPNHLLKQWKSDFYALYPNANILVADKDDFETANRQRFFGRIANGEWDAVVVSHSQFKKIAMPPEDEKRILKEQIEEVVRGIEILKEAKGDRMTIKNQEAAKERMERRLKTLMNNEDKDQGIHFGDLGVDALFVDEAHEFKNLQITTSMDRVAGLGNLAGSQKAMDLFVKCRYLQERNDGRGIFFATGTPISNTIAELYTMQRYMQYGEMKERGLHHFDSWASTFGSVVAGWELDSTGVNYRINRRFKKFQNVPELRAIYRNFADVVTKKDLDRQSAERGERPLAPPVRGGKPQNIVVERSPEQAQYIGVQVPVLDGNGNPYRDKDGNIVKKWNEGSIIHRAEHMPNDPREDNFLKLTNDARKAGLDMRLIEGAADFMRMAASADARLDMRLIENAPDFPGSKINVAVDNLFRIWQESKEVRGTQLVFCDLSTPKSAKKRAAAKKKEETGWDRARAANMMEANAVRHGVEVEGVPPGGWVLMDADGKPIEGDKGIVWFDSEKDANACFTEAIKVQNGKESKKLEKDDDEEGDEQKLSMDELLAFAGGDFSVYDDVKAKLIARGVPAHEIAFIHDAHTDLQKQKLFDDMNRGDVRILLGSTQKMGAGTNVQRRLVALHHLDAPWRPSDLEQREGRILRQGNMLYEQDPDNFEVDIFRYATKQTYDARMWQVIQGKAEGIEQFQNADSLVRDLDDIAGEAANAAEMKAASSGNPLMLMQVTLDAELKKLEAIWKNHQRQQQSLERNIERLASADERADKAVQKWRSEIALRDSNTTEKFQFEHDGKVYGEKEREALFNKIQLRLQEVVTAQIRGKRIVADIGRYRGFDIRVQPGLDRLVFSVQGAAEGYNPSNLSYEKQDQFTMTGFISRLNNYLKSFEERCEEAEATRVKERAEYASAVAAFGKPFPQQALLEALRDDNRQVIAELKKLEANSDYVSDWVPKSEAIKQAANAIKQAAAQSKQEEPPPQPKPEEVQQEAPQQRRVASFSMSM